MRVVASQFGKKNMSFMEESSEETKKRVLLVASKDLDININNELLQEQLFKGYLVELEHGSYHKDWRANITKDDIRLTLQIAWAHIREIPNYYDWLEEMEQNAQDYFVNLDEDEANDAPHLALAIHIDAHSNDPSRPGAGAKMRGAGAKMRGEADKPDKFADNL